MGKTTFDKNRYYAGQVAHFSVWNQALSQTEVTKLYELYYNKFGLETQYNTESPTRYPTNLPTQKPKLSPTRNPPPVSAPTRTNPPPSPTAPSMSPPTTGQSGVIAPKAADDDDDDNDDGNNMGLGTG